MFIEIPGASDDVVLLYGHYDKQPEFSGWDDDLDPWTPVIKDGKLYGRGGADDGYATFGSLTAIRALQEQGVPHAKCVVIIEGCEESGSFDLPYYIDLLEDRIGSPSLVVCLDAECGNYDQLWCTTSLRGNLTGQLRADVLTEGVHSGYSRRRRAIELSRSAQIIEPYRERRRRPDSARRVARRYSRTTHRPGQASSRNPWRRRL